VATKLGMSQGSTRRWFAGEGFPETETLVSIAEMGNVTVDWLLTGRLPKRPIDPKTALGRLHMHWDDLGTAGQRHVSESFEGQLALRQRDVSEPSAKAR
jgi:hypothetical protein